MSSGIATVPSSSSTSSIQSTPDILSPRLYHRNNDDINNNNHNNQCKDNLSHLLTAGLGQPQPISTVIIQPSLFNSCQMPILNLPNQMDQPTDEIHSFSMEERLDDEDNINIDNDIDDIDEINDTIDNNDNGNDNDNDNDINNDNDNNDQDTPQIVRWSRDFNYLIQDPVGILLFKNYLDEVGLGHLLDFYFVCQGLKKTDQDLYRLIIVIFKRFILNPQKLTLTEQCRHNLLHIYKQAINNQNESILDSNTFDEAFKEIRNDLSGAIYQNFLKSKIFIDYINSLEDTSSVHDAEENLCQKNEFELGKTTEESNELDTLTYGTGYCDVEKFILPPIDETSEDGETVIEVSKISQQKPKPPPRTFPPNKLTTNNRERSTYKLYNLETIGNRFDNNPPNPYHVNTHAQYSTVQYNSKKDSEIESISSSDSSFVYSCNEKKSFRNRNGNAIVNVSSMNKRFQRQPTASLKNNYRLAEQCPDEFSRILKEKLNKVRDDQESHRKLRATIAEWDSIREVGVGQYSNNNSNYNSGTKSATLTTSGSTKSALGQALQKIDFSKFENESCQSILDNHIDQVFRTPNADSPTISSVPYLQHNHYVDSSLPPQSPLSTTPQFQHFNNLHISNKMPIPVTLKLMHESFPFKLHMNPDKFGTLTLLSFKQQVPYKRYQQFFFKRQCSELEMKEDGTPYVWEQINDDQAILPLCNGKIYARDDINA